MKTFQKLILFTFALVSALFAQSPVTCSMSFTLSSTGGSAAFDNRFHQCALWTIGYSTTGFTMAYFRLEGAVDNAGSPGTYVPIVSADGTNPDFVIGNSSAIYNLFSSQNNGNIDWIRVNLVSFTTAGSLTVTGTANPLVTPYGPQPAGAYTDLISSLPTLVIDASLGNIHVLLHANITQFLVINARKGQVFALEFCEDGTGGWTVAGAPTSLIGWVAPLVTSANSCASQWWISDGGNSGAFIVATPQNVFSSSGGPTLPTVVISTSGPVADPGGNSVFFFNNSAGALTFTVAAGSTGLQRCYRNATGKSGAITIAIVTNNQIDYNGVNGTLSSGTLVSTGALGDAACLVSDTTNHWYAYVSGGTWVNN